MNDEELWLMEIEMNANLITEQKRDLYLEYVKDFSK